MSKTITIIATLIAGIFFSINAGASILGTNITIFDGQQDTSNTWYTGQGVGQEDQETEPVTARSEVWDLEAMFVKSTYLSLVGQWNFETGEDGAYGSYDRDGDGYYTSGDLFIDVDGVDYGSKYGYDYVFDVDWSNGTYTLFSLDGSSTFDLTTYKTDSNPWKVGSADSEIESGTFAMTTLSSAVADEEGLLGTTDHYLVSFDLSPILTALNLTTMDFTAHFTMECGNDNLMGHGTAPVPEPATIILMGAGLIGIAGFTRKKLNMERLS